MRIALLVALALVAQMTTVSAQKPTVTAKTAEKVDFAKFKTYTWFGGHTAYDPAIHKLILEAVERELAAVGLTKTTGAADVEVVYHSLSASRAGGAPGTKPSSVGTLVVNLLDPATSEQLWHVRLDRPIDVDRSQAAELINSSVALMFERYPTRAPARRD
jgi:Domain of unknown function (DUF4136)